MDQGHGVVFDGLGRLDLRTTRQIIYDREIELLLLHRDPETGAEHYLVRYPAGLAARRHRHSAAQTIVVLEGRLEVDGRIIGPGAYCHFPPEVAMRHQPAGDDGCLFVTIFHGPFDVEPLTEDEVAPR